MPLSAEIQSQLREVRSRFVASLDSVILELDGLLNALPVHGDAKPVMEAIRFRAHKLAGTAPVLGFGAVGQLAGQVENAIDRWKGARSPELENFIADVLERLLDEMERALDDHAPYLAKATA